MPTDPVADMLARIKNAYQAKKLEVVIPHSRFKAQIAKILVQQGYLGEVKEAQEGVCRSLSAYLKYDHRGRPALQVARRVSKPSRRVYKRASEMPRVLGGFGVTVVSTSQGVMTAREAKKKRLGGEIICEVW